MAFHCFTLSLLLTALCSSNAFVPPTQTFLSPAVTGTALQMKESSPTDVSRHEFFGQLAAGLSVSATALITSFPKNALAEETVNLPSGVTYTITTSGDGPKPNVGELAGIRFKAVCVPTGNIVDDIFDKPEPYYTRVGSGGLIKVGDVMYRSIVFVIFKYSSHVFKFFYKIIFTGS